MKKLGMQLKQWRSSAGLSQLQVSRGLGYATPQFISNWERGVSNPPVGQIRALSRLYKVDANVIFEQVLEDTLGKTEVDMRKAFAKAK